MALKVEMMEKTTIKPSSPTPHHLKAFKLSLVDQFVALTPISIILFYSADQQSKNEEQIDLLKRSLSEILTYFYPLAGRFSVNQYIDCNDDGVNFFKTQVSSQLSQVVTNPKAEELPQLLPTDNFTGSGPKVLLSIQANIFDCGGIALGVQISHKIADASSLGMFLCNWASMARRGEIHLAPELDNKSLFPPLDSAPTSLPPMVLEPNLVTKRFIFSESAIASLKLKTSSIEVSLPTKVEAIIGLIWWCFMRAESPKKLASATNIAVNMRGRMDLPLSHHFGNLVIPTITNMEGSEPGLNSLVVQLRESFRKIDNELLKKVGTYEGHVAYVASLTDFYLRVQRGEVEHYMFTSWCRLPFYETDFGWGKPTWASFCDFSTRRTGSLMDTKCGKGVEVWVTLDKPTMSTFESDPQFLSFASPN